jgi:hypothetical protein
LLLHQQVELVLLVRHLLVRLGELQVLAHYYKHLEEVEEEVQVRAVMEVVVVEEGCGV